MFLNLKIFFTNKYFLGYFLFYIAMSLAIHLKNSEPLGAGFLFSLFSTLVIFYIWVSTTRTLTFLNQVIGYMAGLNIWSVSIPHGLDELILDGALDRATQSESNTLAGNIWTIIFFAIPLVMRHFLLKSKDIQVLVEKKLEDMTSDEVIHIQSMARERLTNQKNRLRNLESELNSIPVGHPDPSFRSRKTDLEGLIFQQKHVIWETESRIKECKGLLKKRRKEELKV